MAYPVVKAQVNGATYKAIGVGDETYLIWTVAKDIGLNLTKIEYDDVEINNKKPTQTVQDGNTYIHWSEIPGLTPHYLDGGVINFTTVTHDYQLNVTQDSSEIAGKWANIVVTTLDGDKPIGDQLISIAENETVVCTDYTDKVNGEYGYAITETVDKVDTVTVTWTDPSGNKHTVNNTTQFQVPKVTPTPLPSDDTMVVQFPLLPASDVSNAILFEAKTVDGKPLTFQLDTGAFELMLNAADAKALDAPKLGDTNVQGVGGQSQAYYSQVTLEINGVGFGNVPCVVDPEFQGNSLFGYRFFIDNKYELLISQKHNTVTILK